MLWIVILKTRHNIYFPNVIVEFCLQYVFINSPFAKNMKSNVSSFKVKCKFVCNLDMFEIEWLGMKYGVV